ncbi:ABC transporter ATP-binding protein [Sneathiella marina]|uniref:ABC transporter ATP-binding protein n=1 Tax=Sneathiella marina TaxID=2950108 RepID=A0ABY4W4T3_9PROT|nr:ABC transporter ATP-binding protein [Sneathiella marina]USG62002.1 ABC transporter ATP-binding protein [Sneathiella marina]
MTVLLRLQAVGKNFGGLAAVNNVSFDMKDGEIVGLLGPNGSGKTTLLNLISGAHRATSGNISLYGKNISSLRPDQISHSGIARTFQLVRVLQTMSVSDNVICSVAFREKSAWGREAHEIAEEKLATVGLQDKARDLAGSLNYIDCKRLELARALATEPKLLLLDEWLSGLTPQELETGIELINSIQSSGISILIVEHIMSAIRELCPRCVVMNSGEVIADGPTGEVLENESVVSAYLGGADA